MFTFKIKCPHCQKELSYHMLHRDWDNLSCPHCKKPYLVNMRILTVVVMLLMFMICQQVYGLYLVNTISLGVAIVLGVIFVFFMSILCIHLISWKFGTFLFFEPTPKEIKKQKHK